MAKKVLSAQADPLRGSVIVSGTEGVPNGLLTLTRAENGVVQLVRNGEGRVSTAGFVREDPEPAFGIPLLYRASIVVDDRHIQSNRVLNPKVKNNITGWATGPNRTLVRETATAMAPPRDATTSMLISPYTAGATAGTVTDRQLAATAPSGLTAGRWFVSGQVRLDSPDLWLWADVKAAGSWQDIKNIGTWQQVKSKTTDASNQPFATVWAAVVGPSGTTLLNDPVQVLGLSAATGNTWRTFQAFLDVPAGVPAGSRIIFFHGSLSREYAIQWWLSTVLACPATEIKPGSLSYFDGDSIVPSNPADNMVAGFDWNPATDDASFSWNGTPHASISNFTGPSVITTTTTVTVGRPTALELPDYKLPIYLSDPVSPALGQWFELLNIGELSWAARQDLYDILGKGPQVAVSQIRSWESGEMILMTKTLEEYENARALFATGRILFWRNPDPRFPENGWYIGIGNTKAARPSEVTAWAPERLWTIPWVRVERPSGLIEASQALALP